MHIMTNSEKKRILEMNFNLLIFSKTKLLVAM